MIPDAAGVEAPLASPTEPPVLRAEESVAAAPVQFIVKNILVKVAGSESPGTISVLEDARPSHNGLPVQSRNFEEFLYILTGEYMFEMDELSFVAKPGDFVHVPSGIPHTFQNTSGQDAKLLAIARPGGVEIYFAELAEQV
jgi:mannose-6-phosphate isomerase-like protein (cupin superfamily)